MEFLIRSGVVDGIYTVTLEILAVRILVLVVEGITRQLGNRRINKKGHLRVISTKWTNFLGRGTSASGHVSRVALYVAATISISLVTYGTTGFTKTELIEKEVVFVTETDDVNAQFELAIEEAKGRKANWAFTSRLHWCTSKDKDALSVYSAFCDTKLCMESLGKDPAQLGEDYEMLLDHFAENGRCNDGSDAPKIQLGPDIQMASDDRRLPRVSFVGLGPTQWVELNRSDNFRLYWAVTHSLETENENYFVCALAFYEKYYIRSYTYMEILAEDLVKVQVPNYAITQDWLEDGEPFPSGDGEFEANFESCRKRNIGEPPRDDFVDDAYDTFEILVKNKNVLLSEPAKWLQTATILALTDTFRWNTWQSLTMVNLKVSSAVREIDFVQTQATRISTTSLVGFGILAAVAILLLVTFTICTVLSRMWSYEAGNLALDDNEIYGLLKFQANNLGDARKAKSNRLELGFSSECAHWGVLSEG